MATPSASASAAGAKIRFVPVTPLRQNCAILSGWDGQGRPAAIVVDPGGDAPHIMEALDGVPVEAILLTHGHLDHAGGAMALRDSCLKRQGWAPHIYGPGKEDAFLLAGIERQAAEYGLSGMHNAKPDSWLEHGQRLHLAGQELEVRHVPGHTPGHMVFIDHAGRRVFSGDTLFRQTVGRSDFPYGEGEALLRHIKERILTLPDHFGVFPGHGLPTTIGEERKNNPFFRS